ncbi:MAG: hypothetical protein ACK4H7_01910 [Acidilobaceae archaeon]
MGVKRQRVAVTEGSKVSGFVGGVLRSLEGVVEVLDVDSIYVYPPLSSVSAVLGLFGLEEVTVFVWGSELSEFVEFELEELGLTVVLKPLEGPVRGVPLRKVYGELPKIVLTLDSSILKALASRTSVDGVEYMVVYGLDGLAYMLEGDVHRVTIPGVDAVGLAHTHPEGACGLSRADVRSSVYALTDLVLFEAAVTPTCAFYIARIGLLYEEDFALLLNKGDILEPLELRTVSAKAILL